MSSNVLSLDVRDVAAEEDWSWGENASGMRWSNVHDFAMTATDGDATLMPQPGTLRLFVIGVFFIPAADKTSVVQHRSTAGH